MSEKRNWDCNCRKYLEEQLNNLRNCQVNAKKKIEKLLASEECPYKKLDEKSRENRSNFKSHYCSSTPVDPMENLSHTPNTSFVANAGKYTLCDCGESIRRNWQWIDKSGEYQATDDDWEEHIKSCQQACQSNQIKSNQIKSNQTQSSTSENLENNQNQKNYLPWILGGIGVFVLIVSLVWYFTRKGENK